MLPIPRVQVEVNVHVGDFSEEQNRRINNFVNEIPSRCVVPVILHPMVVTRTLWQFGYEPFPIQAGRTFGLIGHHAYFLPNIAIYLKSLYGLIGFRNLYRGVGASALSLCSIGFGKLTTNLYLDQYYPEFGGEPIQLQNDGQQPENNYNHFRFVLRQAIRDSAASIIAYSVARPFTNIMIRQIASLIGGEQKYLGLNFYETLTLIGCEEGLGGLYSGLASALIAELMMIWSIAGLQYGLEIITYRIFPHRDEEPEEEDEGIEGLVARTDKRVLSVFRAVVPLIGGTLSYPFSLCSTLVSVVGSGLLVSMIPYQPVFQHWQDTYGYLKAQHGLHRGSSLLLRKYQGPVRVDRATGQLYAQTNFFA